MDDVLGHLAFLAAGTGPWSGATVQAPLECTTCVSSDLGSVITLWIWSQVNCKLSKPDPSLHKALVHEIGGTKLAQKSLAKSKPRFVSVRRCFWKAELRSRLGVRRAARHACMHACMDRCLRGLHSLNHLLAHPQSAPTRWRRSERFLLRPGCWTRWGHQRGVWDPVSRLGVFWGAFVCMSPLFWGPAVSLNPFDLGHLTLKCLTASPAI